MLKRKHKRLAWPPVPSIQFNVDKASEATLKQGSRGQLCPVGVASVDSIDDCAKDGGKEFFTEMHCVL